MTLHLPSHLLYRGTTIQSVSFLAAHGVTGITAVHSIFQRLTARSMLSCPSQTFVAMEQEGVMLGRAAAVFVISLAMAMPAWAIKDPETSESFPDQMACEGEQAQAAGVGVREATFGVDVYGAVVYVSPKARGKSIRSTDECVAIRARFVRDVGADKIKEAWLGGFKKQGLSASDATVKKFVGIIGGEQIVAGLGDLAGDQPLKRNIELLGEPNGLVGARHRSLEIFVDQLRTKTTAPRQGGRRHLAHRLP